MLRAYREDSYFEGGEGPGYSSYLAQEATLRATFRGLLRRMRRRGMTGGRLLEVGCAYGLFLDEARHDFRWRAGTDYSPGAAELARKVADAVYVGGLEQVPSGERFDCVVLIHVIEHIYRPRELLERLLARLETGGWVLLAAPDMAGFWRPLLGKRWPFFKVPEHVTYFSRASLGRLLAAAGCERIEPLRYESFFTAGLVAEKLGLSLPGWLRSRRLWLPATTAACAGRKPGR
jgi:2-polyprenyl-3-methyl-5-hydroxy-6-metoxy-1,4-benzoquinol methylase